MNLFSLVKIIFEKPEQYSNVKNSDKSKNFFMINRFMAIKLPLTSQAFNKIYCLNPAAVVDLWQTVARQYNKTPYWIYTKTKKTKKQKKWDPNPNIVKKWMEINRLGPRDFRDAKKLDPKGLKKAIENLELQMNLNDN